MEDQQPGTGDLTTDEPAARSRRRFFRRTPKAAAEAEPAVADAEPTPKVPVGKSRRVAPKPADKTPAEETPAEETPAEETPAEETPADETPAEETPEVTDTPEVTGTPEVAEETPEPEPVTLVPHRPAGRRAVIAVAAASAVFVAASGFAAAMAQPYLADRALYQTKLTIARTATDAITTLWTYNPDDMATLADRASAYLSGDFGAEYRRYIDAIVEPNKQAQVTNTTEVMGAAVESVSPPSIPTEATALVYTNSVATSPVTKNIPSLRYLSYRLTMQREGGDWRIVRMSTITSFDLTPQL